MESKLQLVRIKSNETNGLIVVVMYMLLSNLLYVQSLIISEYLTFKMYPGRFVVNCMYKKMEREDVNREHV